MIGTSKYRDTTLRILEKVLIARGIPPDVDTFGIPRISSSFRWIEATLDLEYGIVIRIVTEFHSLLEVGNADDDIRIRHLPFLEFLLDRTRSRELFVDVDKARLVPQDVPGPAVVRWIFNTQGM